MKTGAAFLAGLVLGAAGAWLVATRGSLPVAMAPTVEPVPRASPSSVGAAASVPPSAATGAAPDEPFLGSPSPAGPALGLPAPGLSSGSVGGASPWAATPEQDAPLGTHAPSPVPGDSTDALITPRSMAPLTDVNLPSVSDLDRLRSRQLMLPVVGYDLRQLRDNYAERRGSRVHEAIDMAAARGTPVVAVDDGIVKKLFTSAAGGLTVYQFDPARAYSYYYAHLDRYAEGLKEGQAVRKGDRLGYVGTSGNAPPGTPHLHFTIFKLAPDRRWWEGSPINPYPLWALSR